MSAIRDSAVACRSLANAIGADGDEVTIAEYERQAAEARDRALAERQG